MAVRRGIVSLCACVVLLAGCQPTTQATPFRLSFSPPPSASPVGSVPPAANSPEAAIGTFVDAVTSGDFSYIASLKGRSRHSVDILPVRGSISVSGPNYALSTSFTFPDERVTVKVEHRYVKRVAWIRATGTAWRRLPSFGEDDVMSPFAQVLTPSDVTLVGQTGPRSDPRFRIEFDSMLIDPTLIPAINLSRETIDRARLRLLIDRNGRPISGTWELHGTGRVSQQLQEVVIEVDMAFSRIGQRVTVTAP